MATFASHFDFREVLTTGKPDRAHVVQFYSSDSSLVREISAIFAKSLRAGQSVIAVMTAAHQRGVLKRLSDAGIDTTSAMQSGRLTMIDALELLQRFMEPGGPNRRRFFLEREPVLRKAGAAAEAKHRRVVAFGEMVSILCGQNRSDDAIRLEQLWNELARTHFFSLRCAYRAKWFKGKHRAQPYAAICAEHSVVMHA